MEAGVTQALSVTRYGVKIAGKPDFESWCEAFTTLLDDKEKSFWGIGDLLIYAEESGAYGEDYAVVLDGKRYRFYTTYTTMTDGMTRIGSGYGYVELPAAST